MDRLVTQENICQQEFKSLMDICFRDSEYFSLTRFGGHAKPHFSHTTISFTEKFQAALAMQDAILQALSRFRISTIETTRWFYISTVPYLYVDLYKATTDSLQILLSYYDNLFLRFHPQISMLPADLCFFHANQLWLGSCSHEKIPAVGMML